MTTSHFNARHRAVSVSLLVLAGLLAFLPFLLQWQDGPARIHVNALYDDAYYYARMALSYTAGHGYSFNDQEQTNGFQPLWMLLITGLNMLAGSQLYRFFLSYLALIGLLNLVFIAWFLRLFQRQLGSLWAILVPTFLMLALPQIYLWGMETLLAVPAVYYLVYCLSQPQLNQPLSASEPSPSPWSNARYTGMGMGVALAWLFLVRLDSLIMLPLLLLWARYGRQAGTRQLLSVALPPVLVAGLYFLANIHWYGIPVPVSGLAKSLGTPHFANFSVYGYALHLLLNANTLVFLVIWSGATISCRGRAANKLHGALLIFAGTIVGQFGYYACFSGWGVWPWYGYLFIGFWLALILSLFNMLSGWPYWPLTRRLLGLVMLLVMARSAWHLLPGTQAAGFAERNMADVSTGILTNKTIIMGDRAGSLGYWAGASTHIVQTEGLVMSKGFLDSKLAGHAQTWIDAHYAVDEVVVDRNWLPVFGSGAQRVYLINEPVQARVWQNQSLLLCFPQSAVLSYQADSHFVRARFAYAGQIPCPAPVLAWFNQAHARGELFNWAFTGQPRLDAWQRIDLWLARHTASAPIVVTTPSSMLKQH